MIENTAQAKAIEKYLADNFGIPGATTSWYDNIKGISVQGDAVLVKTNLLPGDNKASSICGAISGYVYSSNNRALGLQKVRLYGVNSETLVDRDGLSDDCS